MALLLSLLSGAAAFYSFHYFPLTTSIAFLAAVAVLLLKKKAALAVALAVGAIYAFAHTGPTSPANHAPINAASGSVTITGTVISPPAGAKGGGWLQTMKADARAGNARVDDTRVIDTLSGKRITLYTKRPLKAGRRYTVRAVLSPERDANPGGFGGGAPGGGRRFARLTQVLAESAPEPSARAFILNARARVNEHIIKTFDRDSAALIMAVTTGERGFVSPRMRDAFSRAGVAHLLSISGTHFGLFSVLLFAIIKSAVIYIPRKRLERLALYISPTQVAAGLCLLPMLFYLGLSGGSVPSVRSFVMISVFLAGLLIGRKRYWLNSLLLAAIILVLWDPAVILTTSFVLSFSAVLFIGFFVIERFPHVKWTRYLIASLALTLSAYLGTAPLVAYRFHYLSAVSPLTNLAVTPVVAFALVPMSVLASFSYLLTGHFLGAPLIAKTAELTIWLTEGFASVPHSSIDVAEFPPVLALLYYAGFASFFVLKKKRLIALAFAPIAVYAALATVITPPPSVTFLDVGQADSAVVELPDGKTVVIDTGRSGREAGRYLKLKGKHTIDALVITHSDLDHSGGLKYLSANFIVRELWDNGYTLYPKELASETAVRHLKRGDTLEAGVCTFRALHPYDEFRTARGSESDALNNRSLVIKLDCGGLGSMLLTADIEEEATEDLVHLGHRLKSSVIKLPHHGGRNPALGLLIKAASPELAVLSTGGSGPHPTTIELLNNIRTLGTNTSGAIKIQLTAKGIRIKTWNDFRLRYAASPKDELHNIARLFKVW